MTSPLGPGPLIYAHRGDRAHARDNTIDAFELAIAHGADGVELDVQHTADHRLVVYHDDVHSQAGNIAFTHFSDLRRLDPELPDLEAVLTAIGHRCFINIEIKNPPGPGFDRRRHIADVLPAVISEHGLRETVLVSSFDAMSVRRIKEIAPDLLTGQLFTAADPMTALEWSARDGHDAANVPLDWVEDASTIATIHDLGLAAGVWTVNEPDEIERLAIAGADVLITDDPETARAALSDG